MIPPSVQSLRPQKQDSFLSLTPHNQQVLLALPPEYILNLSHPLSSMPLSIFTDATTWLTHCPHSQSPPISSPYSDLFENGSQLVLVIPLTSTPSVASHRLRKFVNASLCLQRPM
jgi:hypothetical protein